MRSGEWAMPGYFDIVIDRCLPCSQSIAGKLYAKGKYVCRDSMLAGPG